jgi:anti-sigma factor RsiW
MSHLDEGTLHALLDGELGSTELMEIEAHLAGCSACSTRLRTAREFLEEADRLVGSVQFGNYASTPGASAAPRPVAKPEPPPPPPPQSPPPREHHPWQDDSPVLLIPDNPESSPLMRRWPRVAGWAAMIALVVGGGYLVSNVAKETPASVSTTPDPNSTIVSGTDSVAPSSASSSDRRDSDAAVPEDGKAPSRPPEDVAAKQPRGKSTLTKPAPVKTAQAKPAPAEPGTADGKKTLAGNLTAKAPRPEAKDENTAGVADTADAAEEAATKSAEQEAVRLQAAQALTELDRERRLNRAAAATAALDQQAAARRAATTPAPPPPTPEQRAQVYLRIGLDEANRQLGGPVHVIEGLNPLFMGLAPGRVAVGADTTRPVVRVVYQDPQGRMIVLDQQRSRPGQGALPAGAWSLGNVTMGLQGEVPPEVLRSLRSRVR